MITVLFFAQLKEQLKTDKVQLNINTPCKVSDVMSVLLKENPQWQSSLDNRTLLSAVNQDMVPMDTDVKDGDEIAFFPPVTGG